MEMETELILPPPPPPFLYSSAWDYFLPFSPLHSPSESTSSIHDHDVYVSPLRYSTEFTTFIDDDGYVSPRRYSPEFTASVDVSVSEADPSAPSCAICRENLVSSNHRVCHLPCAHAYHRRCIVSWLKLKETCPTCRFHVPSSDLAELLASQPISTPRSSVPFLPHQSPPPPIVVRIEPLLPPPPPPFLSSSPLRRIIHRQREPMLPPPPLSEPILPPPPLPFLPDLPPQTPLPPISGRIHHREPRQPPIFPSQSLQTSIQNSPPRRAAPVPPVEESEPSSRVENRLSWRFLKVRKRWRWAGCIGLHT